MSQQKLCTFLYQSVHIQGNIMKKLTTATLVALSLTANANLGCLPQHQDEK